MSLVDTFITSNGGEPGFGTVAKATKYEPVALDDSKDEEWGWGGNDNNGTDDGDNDDKDWGDDDWGDDAGTTNKIDIEMTKPKPKSMVLGSKSMSGGSAISNRFQNSTKTSLPAAPKSMGSVASAMSATMPSSSSPPVLNKSPMVATTASSRATANASQIGGMTMNITSLGPKKKSNAATKPKKKKLLGASDDDLFASMGFGSPVPSSKPKPKPKASLPTTSGSRWATASTTPSTIGAGSSTAFAKSPASYPSKAPTISPAVGAMATPIAKTPVPVPAPALIPDGFGDDDDLDIELDDDDFGFDNTDTAGGNDDWGDGDDDLDDLLNT